MASDTRSQERQGMESRKVSQGSASILDFWLPKLCKNKLLFFNATKFGVICYSSSRKLTHQVWELENPLVGSPYTVTSLCWDVDFHSSNSQAPPCNFPFADDLSSVFIGRVLRAPSPPATGLQHLWHGTGQVRA